MNFGEFARICEHLEGISGRLEMIGIISRVLPTLGDDELPVFIRFVMGRIFPDWSPEKLGIGPSLLYEGVAYVAGKRKDDVILVVNRTGDVGKAVEELLAAKEQTSFFSEELTLLDVWRELSAIAATSGNKSQKEKLKIVRKLFSNARPLGSRVLPAGMCSAPWIPGSWMRRLGFLKGERCSLRRIRTMTFRTRPQLPGHCMNTVRGLSAGD